VHPLSLLDRLGARASDWMYRHIGERGYDWIYRAGAPWGQRVRRELVTLVEKGRISPERVGGRRAIDLGCGEGRDTIYLATKGFDAVGIDFSRVAIRRARAAANKLDPKLRPRFVRANLLEPPADLGGPFDLLFDGGALDDLPPSSRGRAAEVVTQLSRSGSVFVMWTFYSEFAELPAVSLNGPSRWIVPGLTPGEEKRLFGHAWDIEPIEMRPGPTGFAAFIMTRR
jgi:SAM-dependent methyltransferase